MKSNFKCPVCNRKGFMSIYVTKDKRVQCTDCANKMRFDQLNKK